MITAPYNFVPLNEKVITPYWGPAISHDKPFIDAKSGVLSVEMTAHSPIFVRNGEVRQKDKDGTESRTTEFNHFRGNYFIPGSSIKGMLRNFIEAMTFCRMDDKVNDVKYSVRDFTKGAKDAKIYDPSVISKESNCGWLRLEGGKYFLTPCSRPGRISHTELDKLSGSTKMSQYYQRYENVKSDNQKSASAKYKAFPFKKDGYTFKHQNIAEPEDGIGREKFIIDETGRGKKGTIVFTGQPGIRKENENQGKQYEFIFFDYGNQDIPLERDGDGKPHEVIRNFFHAYYDHDKGQQKEDWKFKKKQLQNGERIPVFYRLKDQSKAPSANNILDMGLALLFKTTYQYSVKESILNYQELNNLKGPDFADCLFGYIKKIGDNKYDSLKGRVTVSHAFAGEDAKELKSHPPQVLGSPKASYYPNYIHQEVKDANGAISGNYSTFKDRNGRIRGWKRYPVRNSGVISNPAPLIKGKVNKEASTEFTPLAEGTKFTFQIAYHNLRKEELGALISALTFHGNQGFSQNIGMAKPLGFGKVSLSIINEDKEESEALRRDFEAFMDFSLSDLNTKWLASNQVTELFAMCKPSEKGDTNLKYQKMDMEKKINDFNRAKKDKLALLDYTKITEPVKLVGKVSPEEYVEKRKFHISQATYFESLNVKEKADPTIPYRLRVTRELKDIVQKQKEKLIQQLEVRKIQLKEEKLKLIAQGQRERIEKAKEEKLKKPINLDAVKLNSRAFENLKKAMKVFHVKYKDGPLKDERDIQTLTEKLEKIYIFLSDKEKAKWKDPNLETNQYFKTISK